MAWILRAEVASGLVDAVSTVLWSGRTTGIATTDIDDRTVALVAGFDRLADAQAAHGALRELGAAQGTVERYDETSWHRTDTTTVGDLTLEVGGAFGHGAHPTTDVCLRLLRTLVAPGDRVLDFGTGTGVLALTAATLGADSVDAVEIDPTALAVAERNRWRNAHLYPQTTIRLAASLDQFNQAASPDGDDDGGDGHGSAEGDGGDGLRSAEGDGDAGPRHGNGEDARAATGYRLVLANVLLPVHQQFAGQLMDRLSPSRDARLVTSGVLATQADAVRAAYRRLSVVEVVPVDDDWVGIVFGV